MKGEHNEETQNLFDCMVGGDNSLWNDTAGSCTTVVLKKPTQGTSVEVFKFLAPPSLLPMVH
jgi:hypothetical protein